MRLNTGITFFFIRAYNNLVEAKVSLKRIEVNPSLYLIL
jgi:hypothetical protein